MVKEQRAADKEKARERVRSEMKEWYSQQGQLISEINKMRREDQQQNLSINQANLNEFKLKILFKHSKKDKSLKKIFQNKNKLEKIRNNIQATLILKKETDSRDLFNSISDLYKKPGVKQRDEAYYKMQ